MGIPKYIEKKIMQQIEYCEKAKKLEREIDEWCGMSGFDPYTEEWRDTKGKLQDAVAPINLKKLKQMAENLEESYQKKYDRIRFTGHYDINHRPIYLGDTVKERGNGLIGKVEFNTERGAFGLEGCSGDYTIEDAETEWEVIGNKH